jgi:5,10-methylene-tetrahydrofolate dehydrogenase/methenyl tetrahydrofolate cyclohydrolase
MLNMYLSEWKINANILFYFSGHLPPCIVEGILGLNSKLQMMMFGNNFVVVTVSTPESPKN